MFTILIAQLANMNATKKKERQLMKRQCGSTKNRSLLFWLKLQKLRYFGVGPQSSCAAPCTWRHHIVDCWSDLDCHTSSTHSESSCLIGFFTVRHRCHVTQQSSQGWVYRVLTDWVFVLFLMLFSPFCYFVCCKGLSLDICSSNFFLQLYSDFFFFFFLPE